MNDVTRILARIDTGDVAAAEQLLPLVYNELRKLAAAKLTHEKPGQTLQATALVHEAYLRLVQTASGGREAPGTSDADSRPPTPDSSPLNPEPRPLAPSFDSRGHFFAAAAEAMRRILIERARHKRSAKRGGNLAREALDLDAIADVPLTEDILALNEALQKLETADPHAANLVKLRYFAGLTIPQAAEALGVSPRTADSWWSYAKAWLMAELRPDCD